MTKQEFNPAHLVFKRIDFDSHSDLCLKFRADSFRTSFGNDNAFWEEDGEGGNRYLDWLKGKDPAQYGSFHIWKHGEVIGQMELGLLNNDSSYGYINLFYLIPECRGEGFSPALNDFAKDFLCTLGVNKAKLSVSPTNKRAWNYYLKQGWVDKGPRNFEAPQGKAQENLVHWMELQF